MKKVFIHILIYIFITLFFYLITIDFNKNDFKCENVRENILVNCSNVEYYFKETPLWASMHFILYPRIFYLLILLLIEFIKYRLRKMK